MLLQPLTALAQPPSPPWLDAVQRGFQHQAAEQWGEAVVRYRAAIAAGLPAQHQMAVASNLGLALQNSGRGDEAVSYTHLTLPTIPLV